MSLSHKSMPFLGLGLLLPALALPVVPARATAPVAASKSAVQAPQKPAPAVTQIAPQLSVRQLEPGVFIINHAFPYPANMVLVEMKNHDLVLVDTTYTDAAANQLLDWIEKRFGKRRLIAISTHFHVDRIGGNRALIQRGIPVYGSDRIAPLLKTRGEAMRALMLKGVQDPAMADAYRRMVFTPPNHPFSLKAGLTLPFGSGSAREEVQIRFTGEGHAPDNVSVWFPSRRLLAGGCMVLAGPTRGNTADANLAQWPGAIKALLPLEPLYVIPGHGDSTSPALLRHTLDVLAQR